MEHYWKRIADGLIAIGKDDLRGRKLAAENGATLQFSDQDYLWYKKQPNKVSEITTLGEILKELDDCNLECDGLTRVISLILLDAGIKHQIKAGKAEKTDGKVKIEPHIWIALEDGKYIDFRVRMWLGNDESIPHGHFNPSNYPSMRYITSNAQTGAADPFAAILATINNIDVHKLSQLVKSSIGSETT